MKNRMKNIYSWLKNNFTLFEVVTFLIYLTLIIIISLHHEFSLDENQSFLIARDLNISQIIAQLKYEGHSFIWYFLLLPIAKLTSSIGVQKIIPIIFSSLSALIILKKAPFNKFIKALILFSPGMIYYYSCFSRPYCMIIFLLVSIASLYKERHKHPYVYATLIGILSNTHLVMLPVSCLLTLLYIFDEENIKNIKKDKEYRTKFIKSLLIIFVFLSIEIIFVIYGYYYCSIVNHYGNNMLISNISNLYYLFYSTWLSTEQIYFGTSMSIFCNVTLVIILLLGLIGSLLNPKYGAIITLQFIFMYLIHSIFWFVIPTRAYLPLYIVMFCLWIAMENNEEKTKRIKISNTLLTLSLISFIILTIPNNYKCIIQDYNKLFSTGKDCSEYIKKNIPKKSVFIYTYIDYQQSIVPYLDKNDYKIYSIYAEDFITFSTWENEYKNQVYSSNHSLDKTLKTLEKEYDNIYVLTTNRIGVYSVLGDYDKYDFECIYKSNNKKMMSKVYAWDIEEFDIYRIKRNKGVKS